MSIAFNIQFSITVIQQIIFELFPFMLYLNLHTLIFSSDLAYILSLISAILTFIILI